MNYSNDRMIWSVSWQVSDLRLYFCFIIYIGSCINASSTDDFGGAKESSSYNLESLFFFVPFAMGEVEKRVTAMTEQKSPRELEVGFIGVGVMGRPMVSNLLKAGFPCTMCNRHR